MLVSKRKSIVYLNQFIGHEYRNWTNNVQEKLLATDCKLRVVRQDKYHREHKDDGSADRAGVEN